MAEYRPVEGPAGLEETDESYEEELDWNQVRRGRHASRAPVRHWREVPVVSVLPSQRKQLRFDFLMRGILVITIGLIGLFAISRYSDWTDADDRAEAVEARSRSVNRQLATRQEEIEPLQAQITLLTSELESAEKAYALATADRPDWFTVMDGLFAISVSGVDFVSAAANSQGKIVLVGIATSTDAIASLPIQLSRSSSRVTLQGIQWDAGVSPPVFTAEFQINR